MANIRLLVLSALLACCLSSFSLAASPMSVTFLNPGAKGDAFFGMMTSFMQAAADDLNIELEVIYCDRDHLKLHEEGLKLLERDRLPQYLILINEKNAIADLLPDAADLGVKVALINEGLHSVDRLRLGDPGKRVPNWVLEFLPDDRQAGYMLAKSLIETALGQSLVDEEGNVNIVGVAGTYQTGSSSSRVKGLQQAVEESDKAELLQVAPAYWEEDRAEEVVSGLIDRYPETRVIWAASDLMARGGLTASAEMQAFNSGGVIAGGIDWAEFALHMVEQGELAATVGGHFMDGGWAMVMLYDLHHGKPLPKTRYLSNFSLITKKNVGTYLKHFGSHEWSPIDFRRFSRTLNPDLNDYRFGLEAVMEQLR